MIKKQTNIPKGVNLDRVRYWQDGDSCDGEEIQYLDIVVEDAGGGQYFAIKTDRWAFDKIDDLVVLLKQVKLNEN